MNHFDEAQSLAVRYGLNKDQRDRLLTLATPPLVAQSVRLWFWRVVAILASALGGLGIIMWVAANWENFGRFGRFALLEMIVVVTSLAAAWKLSRPDSVTHSSAEPSIRNSMPSLTSVSTVVCALGLVAFLSIGALFAYFGQTYQTGADPWQLFALWAVLVLPLCLALRSDIMWTPWVVVVGTGVALWLNSHTQHSWRMERDDFPAYLSACVMGALLAFAVGPFLRRWTGAGLWSLRVAVTINVMGLVTGGAVGLFSESVAPQYALALFVVSAGCIALTRPQLFDVYSLSVFALSLIVLLMTGLARLLFSGSSGDWFGALLVLALAAAGMLAAAVRVILHLQKMFDRSLVPVKPSADEEAL